MLDKKTLSKYLLSKYPQTHNVVNNKALRTFVMDLKNQYLKKSSPLSKVQFDDKIHVINNALGLHSFVSRVQGSKLKSKNEIRIATVFKSAPEEFLQMIVVHELAHLKEKERKSVLSTVPAYVTELSSNRVRFENLSHTNRHYWKYLQLNQLVVVWH